MGLPRAFCPISADLRAIRRGTGLAEARRMRSLSWIQAGVALLPFVVACSGGGHPVDQDDGDVGAEEGGALTQGYPVGTVLKATSNVWLRKSASTSGTQLDLVQKGETVTVQSALPSNGFLQVKLGSQVGWSYGSYYQRVSGPPAPPSDPPATGGAAPTAAQLRAATASCSQVSPGKYRPNSDAGVTPTIPICGLPGAVFWTADLDVDCDGVSSSACNSTTDPWYQSQTAATDSHGHPLDAAALPYVVVPGKSSLFDFAAAGVRMGSVVAVIYKDRVVYGVVGDIGPKDAIGEASYAMAKALGINPNPKNGGADSGVTYIAFTGTAAIAAPIEDAQRATTMGTSLASKLVSQ